MPKYSCGGVVRNLKMKIRRSCRSSLTFPSTMFAVGVGLLFVVYIEVSHSASISVSTDASTPSTLEPVVVNNNSSSPASPPPPPPPTKAKPSTKSPSRITTLRSRLGKPFKGKTQRTEVPPPIQPGRMKASDIKACISKAFCEVNSASKVPNYAVNKEFFDLMNQIDADRQSEEDADSGSTSVEYDEDEEDEEDDDDASSEESSSERMRGYPPGPPPPGYRFGRKLKNGGNSTSAVNGTTATARTSLKVKDSKKKHVLIKKSGKKTKVAGKKMLKKYANGTLIVRRRSRLEIQAEKKQQEAYLTRKQREMGQVNDLAALIRISADIGLTLRNPRKCRTLFNKCTMSHEQIVDLFNQTLMAVTTPATSNNAPSLSSSPTATYNMLTTTKKKGSSSTLAASSPTLPSKPQSTSSMFYSELPSISTSIKSHSVAPTSSLFVTTQAPHTSTPDDNRSSKSRHDFSDEDVEYLTDTEIQPVQTYALFVNDAPEDSVKTQEEVNVVQETFKKYANAFPAESPLPGDLPSLREKNTKNKNLKPGGGSGRSTKNKLTNKRGKPSSEEDDDDDDDDEDDLGSTSLENRSGYHSSRIDSPYHGYNRDMKEDDADSREPVSAGKESSEGILPPLVQKEKPYKPDTEDEDEEDDEEDSDESLEADAEERNAGRTQTKSKTKKKGGAKPAADDESSEEDDIDVVDDDHQSPPAPWTPVYQMHMSEKEKKGHKKKQKGPYKGGEGPYDDIPHPGPPPSSSHSSGGVLSSALNSLKKPWGGSSASHEAGQEPAPHYHHPSSHSQETPYGDAPYHHGGPPPYGGGPLSASQEAGGMAEQKPGFFQSIMSWFSGNKNDPNAPHQPDSPYGAPAGPYGGQPPYAGGGGSGEHHHHQMDDHHDHQTATGSPWPSQPDPAGVGHFGQSHAYRYRNPESSEEDSVEEILLKKPMKPKKKAKRRFRGRSDSIITSPPKKPSSSKKAKTAGGPPPPIVIVPNKDTKSSGGIGVYEQLIQADGGITSGSNMGKKKTMSSNKENKRTKKAAIKPKNNQNQTPSKKKRRPSQKSHANRGARESGEDDDDEAYSSEEIYNQQVAKLKTGGSMELVSLGGGSSNSNGANKGGSNKNSNKNGNKQSNSGSFPNYFESMFGTEEKDKHTIKGKDDGGLLYGFDALSSTLNANPLELPTVATKKSKPSTYKVNKNKKKQKKKGNTPPVKFNNKEVVESSEEEDKKK